MNRHLLTLLFAVTAIVSAAQNDSTLYGVTTDLGSYERFRVGGYGEVQAAFKDYGTNRFYGSSMGNTKTHRATISIPRFVLAGDYKFNRRWMVGFEIEFESGGTGSAYEIENTENGEYETEVEKGGEVAIEQFHLTYVAHRALKLQAGHLIVPVGLNNAHHEPINFFGSVRPEGETGMIPNTWHETGLKLYGEYGRGWSLMSYEAMVVAGLNANGFDRNNWLKKGKQGIFEVDNFTCPAYAFRLNYHGVPGLRVGGSLYYCPNTAANSDKLSTYAFKVPVSIWNVDAQYQNRWLTARANILSGHVGNTVRLSAANQRQSSGSPYSRTSPIASKAVSYAAEAGLRLKGFVGHPKMPDLIPFVRYEYYNTQQRVEAPQSADPRLQTSMWTAGLNYRPLPYIILKADYTTRRIGGGRYNSENEFGLGVAFVGWFSGRKSKGNGI